MSRARGISQRDSKPPNQTNSLLREWYGAEGRSVTLYHQKAEEENAVGLRMAPDRETDGPTLLRIHYTAKGP